MGVVFITYPANSNNNNNGSNASNASNGSNVDGGNQNNGGGVGGDNAQLQEIQQNLGKVKLTEDDTLDYLKEKIDNNKIQIENGRLTAKIYFGQLEDVGFTQLQPNTILVVGDNAQLQLEDKTAFQNKITENVKSQIESEVNSKIDEVRNDIGKVKFTPEDNLDYLQNKVDTSKFKVVGGRLTPNLQLTDLTDVPTKQPNSLLYVDQNGIINWKDLGEVGGNSIPVQYIESKPPTTNVNPPSKGVLWFDTSKQNLYVCVDNTPNQNVWLKVAVPYDLGNISTASIITADANPTPDANISNQNVVWINKKTMEWFVIDKITDEGIWWKGEKGTLVVPLGNVDFTLVNPQYGQPFDLQNAPDEITEITIALYGEGWQGGNYHHMLFLYPEDTSRDGNWLYNAYYGNGFTLRTNCPFSYKYLQSPPYGNLKLVAIFRINQEQTEINFYQINEDGTFEEKYYQKVVGSAGKLCPNIKKIVVGSYPSGGYPLGGTIYRLDVYYRYITTDLSQVVNTIIQ